MIRRFRDYDPFAWLYSHYWGSEFHQQVMPVLEQLALKQLPKHARILDLCCGDGRVSSRLAKRGFEVTGVDGSEEMLTYARQRCPKIDFYLKDARNFSLPDPFDAVVSTFDSLNHIMDPEDLDLVFRNVFNCLKPGGVFIFDLNREEAYTSLWAGNSHSVDDKAVSITRGTYDDAQQVAHCDVTLFRKAGSHWDRSDFRLSQRFHPDEVVIAKLQRAGFSVRVFDATRDLGMQGQIGMGRNFFAARKDADPSRNP